MPALDAADGRIRALPRSILRGITLSWAPESIVIPLDRRSLLPLTTFAGLAALLAAGLSGIEQELELETEFVGDAYGDGNTPNARMIPETLREATQLLDQSAMLRAAFGNEVIDHYVHTAKHEQAQFDRAVTDWEVQRGFERA